MKNLYIILSLLFGLSISADAQEFYDVNNINTIEISFQESNWDYLLDQMAQAGDEERLMGSVSINGQVFDSAGIRYKGNSTYNPNQVKNPLNIKLDYIIDDQLLDGYGTLKLANGFKDPTLVREVLSYETARKYFPASQSNYANVYINGTHLGLYTNDQSVDKFFMQSHFGSRDNTRAKGEISSNGPPSGGVWEYYGQDSTDYFGYYDMKSDYGWGELIQFLDTLNNHEEYVHQLLDIDRHLWFLAFSNLLVNLDGPINNPQNHYLYKDDNGRFNPIPWDLNESFGVFKMHQTLGNMNTNQLQQFSPFANINEANFPIISHILSNDTYRKMYVAHMKTILEENFSNEQYLERALEIQGIIEEDVQADQNKFYSYSDFTSNVYNSVGGGPNSIIGIAQLMDARVDYISGLSEFQAVQPQIASASYSPEEVSANSEVWLSADIAQAEQVFLAYRQSQLGVFEKIEMYDDGNHQDGAANDGVYGGSILVGHSDIQYYIYAENEEAVAFLPVRAEYEFFNIPVSSDLVINEFMADNETIASDQDGEFDDWIELYNNGSEAISLDGYFLSDDPTEMDLWAFPDTLIAAGDYLIIWADKDTDQEGLHADFKLSSSGESIILSDPDLNIMDVVEFGEQYTDTSTGRFPNGSGDFILMLPTFGAENNMGITAIEEQDILVSSIRAYPNPFRDYFTIEFTLEKPTEASVQVFNVYGQSILLDSSQNYQEGLNSIRIDASQFSSGIWVCQLQLDNESYSFKLLK